MSSNEDRSEEGNLSHPIFRLIITSTDNAAMDKQVNVFEKGCIIFSIPCVNRWDSLLQTGSSQRKFTLTLFSGNATEY